MFRFVLIDGIWHGLRIDSVLTDPYMQNHLDFGKVVAFCNSVEKFASELGIKNSDIVGHGLSEGHTKKR